MFPATFAWHTVDRERPLAGVIGGLGVQLAVLTESGPLWQRRGRAVDAPGLWSISAAGACIPGVPLKRQVLAEANEELGLRPTDLVGMRPLAVVTSQPRRLVEVVYAARLRSGAVALVRLLARYLGRSAGRSARAPSAPNATLARAVTR